MFGVGTVGANKSYLDSFAAPSNNTRRRKQSSEPRKTTTKRKSSPQAAPDSEQSPPIANSTSKYLKTLESRRIALVDDDPIETPAPPAIQCVPVGKEFRIDKDVFIGKSTLYKTELHDYTLITDAPFDVQCAPLALKPLLQKRWVYKLHINPTLSPVITRSVLRDRVIGGQILAYRYTECSVAGNMCVYYGFVPTLAKQFPDSHSTCYIAASDVWPRKLYVYLKLGYACNCSPGCTMWTMTLDGLQTAIGCVKHLNWDRLYVMMGDVDRRCVEAPKAIRSCEVCAQCFACSNSVGYCRAHKVCKHKTAKQLSDVVAIAGSAMKICRKYY